jgi:hypothetical protein
MALVTDDGAILAAADDVGLRSHVRRLDEHLASIGIK